MVVNKYFDLISSALGINMAVAIRIFNILID